MRTKRTKAAVAGIVSAAVLMGGAFSASPAQAGWLQDQLRAKLEAQLKKDPSQVQNPLFQTQAISLDLAIPATLRLSQKTSSGFSPSTSKVRFEIGDLLGLGTKEATLYGSQKLKLRLGWPLGTVKMELPAQPGGNFTANGPGLSAAPVALFTDPAISGQTVAEGGCSDYAVGGADNPFTPPAGVDPGTLPAAADWFAKGGADATNRTAALSLAVAETVNGKANIFTGDLDAFTLTATTPFANVLRLPSGADRCRQAWTGSTQATVPVRLDGKVSISPGLTKDLKIKLGNLKLATPAGEETDVVLPACLTPYKYYTATEGSPTPLPQPAAACGADGSAVPAAEGGNPAFNGTGFGKVDVPAQASISNLEGELLIG